MPDADPLLTLLRNTDAPCPKCSYNLRGIDKPACPECGHAFSFAELTNRDRVSLAWMITLIAYAAALPWSIFYTWQRLIIRRAFVYGEQASPPDEWPGVSLANPWFVLSYGYWLSVPVVVVLLVMFRRRIEAWPAWQRWSLMVVSTILTLLAYRRWQWVHLQLPGAPRWGAFWWLNG